MRYQSFNLRLERVRSLAPKRAWTEHVVGTSFEGRPIIAFQQGGGSKRIMAWSLMHGNEPTGFEALLQLMAVADLESSYLLIPILNPDGAEAFTRLNAQGIDVNRDARNQVSAEAKALVAAYEAFQPELVLNLHDQRPRFFPKGGKQPASFSLLAPKGHPLRPNLAQNNAQQRAKRVLAKWAKTLEVKWAGGVARFDDQFYPNAFGEFFQEQGVASITFETGIGLHDWSRSTVAAQLGELLEDLDKLPGWENLDLDTSAYENLPMNESPANEWLIHHAEGCIHLRLHESVQQGVYYAHWLVDSIEHTMPSWKESHCKQSLTHLELGTVLTLDQIHSFGISEDFGLNN